ncbi:hypothetical protein JCGZ_03281 [Jatropha curcas]|uniref:Uncharacterized protein n=1 Tax=Jatropha curcas TaxID=180498 RepID=A0A067JDJ6_JATCU|nr:hypothetical protein JCGZ_03281 [Jatropha curcas]
MSQISEIPASAYTPEMETLGALPDILTFDSEPVPVNRNPLTPDTTVAASAVAGYGVPGPDLENGRLRRHQARQSSAVSRLQAEVERLWTRLEVEGIPLDSSDEDEDGSSSDDAPSSPPPAAAAGPSSRRR